MSENKRFELLVDPANTIYAVNCRIEDTTLHCGALYVEPQIPFQRIRLAYNSASIDIELPEELRNLSTPARAWDVALKIYDEQIREPSFFT